MMMKIKYMYVFIHSSIKTRIETELEPECKKGENMVFIHSSIKTRIETFCNGREKRFRTEFLYIVPLKQGLKLPKRSTKSPYFRVFIHSSIKTRIETRNFPDND